MALMIRTPPKTISQPPKSAPDYSRSPHCCTASQTEYDPSFFSCTTAMASGVNCRQYFCLMLTGFQYNVKRYLYK